MGDEKTEKNAGKEHASVSPKMVKTETLHKLMFQKHLEITFRVVIITLATIGIFGGGGSLIDRALGTKPIFMIIGLVISFPLTQIILIRSMKKLVKKHIDA